MDMTGNPERFGVLLPLWPDLHTLVTEAEQNADKLPDFSTIRLRSFSEAMVCHLFRHHGLQLNDEEKQFDRLQLLQQNDLLDRRIYWGFCTPSGNSETSPHTESVLYRWLKPTICSMTPSR